MDPFADDRRGHPRTSVKYKVKARNLLNNLITDVVLVNASNTGIQFETRKFMIEDDRVSLTFRYPDRDKSFDVEGKIVWSKSTVSDVWNVGFEFHGMPFSKIQEMFRLLQISG